MISFRSFRSVAVALVSLLAVACGAEAGSSEGDAPSESFEMPVEESETQYFNTGSGPRTGSTARCYSLTCPAGKQDDCFVPCMTAGGTTTRCADACGCTATLRECSLTMRQ